MSLVFSFLGHSQLREETVPESGFMSPVLGSSGWLDKMALFLIKVNHSHLSELSRYTKEESSRGRKTLMTCKKFLRVLLIFKLIN